MNYLKGMSEQYKLLSLYESVSEFFEYLGLTLMHGLTNNYLLN